MCAFGDHRRRNKDNNKSNKDNNKCIKLRQVREIWLFVGSRIEDKSQRDKPKQRNACCTL